jgi:UDP-2,3-diacylglucosamine pyrophosphatase LpxH
VERIVFVSDFHMSAGNHHFSDDDAFVSFVDHLLHHGGPEVRLVILGDFLDLLRVSPFNRSRRDAPHKLDAIVREHAPVFEALSRLLNNQVPVDIVAGNHDVELVFPEVQRHLRALVRDGLTFHPWIYYVPGVVYAEHGQQYHDINSFTTLLCPLEGQDEIETPLGLIADNYSMGRQGRARQAASSVMKQARSSTRSQAECRRAYREVMLGEQADVIGLPHEVLVALDRLSSSTGRAALMRAAETVIRRTIRRPLHPGWNDYIQPVASWIQRFLRASGHDVPHFVFGHTHTPLVTSLGTDLDAARYLNTGTWSSITSARPIIGPKRFTFVEIDVVGDTSASRLCAWDPASRSVTDIARPQAQIYEPPSLEAYAA